EEESALALRAERKRQPGQIHDGHALEVDTCAAPAAQVRTRIESDRVGAQLPGLVVDGAGGETHVLETDDASGRELHAFRRASRTALAQRKPGGLEGRALVRRVASFAAFHVDE